MRLKELVVVSIIGVVSFLEVNGVVFAETSNANVEFTGGNLTLDSVSSIEFGSQQISASTVSYESTTLDPSIQVTDNRGTGTGWDVTAQASNFTETVTTETPTLIGSTITFTDGVVSTLAGSTSTAPTAATPVTLETGGSAVSVVTADAKTGLGTWVNKWSNDNVMLEVPAGSATKGQHTAEITWTLTDGPGQ